MQNIGITQPFINSAEFNQTAFVLLRRVSALIDIFELVTTMMKFLQHVQTVNRTTQSGVI